MRMSHPLACGAVRSSRLMDGEDQYEGNSVDGYRLIDQGYDQQAMIKRMMQKDPQAVFLITIDPKKNC